MYAVRQVVRVSDNKIVLDLSDFPSEYAEVIVLPSNGTKWDANGEHASVESTTEQTIRAIQALDTSQMTEAQRAARERTLLLLAEKPQPGAPRRLGIFDGLVEIADDFNDPLPDEEIYWGSLTDEYGMSIEK
jgi:hypothetical protein